jgi:4-amino-4-deoxy-L-arabinose transferase-like glycosyltransferase
MFARRILIDMGLTMCMTLTLTCFAMAEVDPKRRRRWLLAMYVSVGLGVLTKGPVAAVLPALIFIVYLAFHRELGRIRTMMLPAGAVIVAAIVAPWYIALYMQSGWTNILSFFIGENLERYTSLVGPQSRKVWFYLPVVLTDGLPWSLLLPGALALWWHERSRIRLTPHGRIRTLLLVWIAVFVGFFSVSQTKQDLYIFPIVGAVTVLAADVIARALEGRQRSAWLLGALWTATCLLVLAGAGILWLFAQPISAYELSGARLAGLLFVVGGAAIAGLLLVRRLAAAVVATLAVTIAFCWTLSLRVLPDFERYKPVVPLSEAFLARARPGDVLAHYDVALPSMVFYTRRHIDVLFHRDPFLETMRSGLPVFAVLPESRYLELQPAMGVVTCVIGRQPTSDIKLREILAGQPPPAVLLITTRCNPSELGPGQP